MQAIRSTGEDARAASEVPLLVALVVAEFAFGAAIDPFIGDTHQYVPAYTAVGIATWFTKPVEPAAIDQVLTLLGCTGQFPRLTSDSLGAQRCISYDQHERSFPSKR